LTSGWKRFAQPPTRPIRQIGPVSYTHLDVYKRQISPVLQDIRRKLRVLRVIVELNWTGDAPDEPTGVTDAEHPIVVTETDSERGVIVVRFEKAIEDALATVDNAGERLFMREILLAIRRRCV